MNNASRSILIFGIYVVIVGLTLIVIPNTLLVLLGFPTVTEVWVRVLGVLAAILGLYYVQAAREHNVGFYRMTIWGRALFMASLTALGLLTPGHAPLILFGLVDLAFAAWTWFALRQETTVSLQAS
jgi:hypothetical protein